MSDIKDRFDDWMVRVTFAEAGKAEAGFESTGEKLERKIKIALDKLMLVRTERAAAAGADAVPEKALETEPPSGRAAAIAGEPLQVMIVDDEPIVGRRLKPALSRYGMEVEVFQDPREALSRFDEKAFDVVVTDMKMEELDGLQVVDHIMSTSANTRVIMITGYGSVEVAREALSKGAFDFISKPFKAKDIRAVINKAALSLGFKDLERN